MGNSTSEDGGSSGFWSGGLAAGAVLIVGILAAVGVSGDFLPRLVRNEGTKLLWLFLLAIGMTTIAVAATLIAEGQKSAPALTVAMGVVLAATAWLGVSSINAREEPGVSLSVVEGESGSLLVTAQATGSGLRSQEHMLLRLIGITDVTDDEREIRAICRKGTFPEATEMLSWTEVGPDSKGDASTEASTRVTDGWFSYFCAYAALQNRDGTDDGEVSWTILASQAPLAP